MPGSPIFRPGQPSDHAFVSSAWLSSYRTSPWAGGLEHDRYFDAYRAQIHDILSRPGVRVVVAADPEPENPSLDIYGYVVAEPERNIIHWVYVKDGLRRKGLGSSLCYHVGVDLDSPVLCSYWNHTCSVLSKKFSLSYRPQCSRKATEKP